MTPVYYLYIGDFGLFRQGPVVDVTKVMYFITVLKYIFHVSVIYLVDLFFGNLTFTPPHISTNICTLYPINFLQHVSRCFLDF